VTDAMYYCRMANVPEFDTWEFQPGIVYMIPRLHKYDTKIFRAISYSDKVWIQGIRGGVKIAKDKIGGNYGYITGNKKAMQEFMWVKLKAQSLQGYT
jgi:hypothetical protein